MNIYVFNIITCLACFWTNLEKRCLQEKFQHCSLMVFSCYQLFALCSKTKFCYSLKKKKKKPISLNIRKGQWVAFCDLFFCSKATTFKTRQCYSVMNRTVLKGVSEICSFLNAGWIGQICNPTGKFWGIFWLK